MENEKSAAFTLKNTNERIDKIESLMEKDGDRLASLKSSLFSLIVFVIALPHRLYYRQKTGSKRRE